MDYFKNLPTDITLDILSRLPAESVLDCKLVCTNWQNLISRHPSFYKLYLNHLLHPTDCAPANDDSDSGKLGFFALTREQKFYYVEYNEAKTIQKTRTRRYNFTSLCMYYTRVIGSCNGLVCHAHNQYVCICNPFTREYVLLPEFKSGCKINFGYVSSTNEYKVVGIYESWESNVEFHVYTLGSGKGWRYLGNVYSQFGGILSFFRGVFANGAVNWLDRDLERIIKFDLAEEKFCESLSTPPLPEYSWYDARMGVLNGFLYISAVADGDNCFDIWVLKQKKDQEEHQSLVWSKDFEVVNRECIGVTKSTGCVLYFEDCYIYMYDTNTLTSERLVKFKHRLLRVPPHENTLVSLKELGEEDSKVVESIQIEETKSREQPSKQPSQHCQQKSFNFKKAFGF